MSYIIVSTAATPRRSCPPRRWSQACSLFRRFHCFRPERMLRMRCRRRIPGVMVKLGRLRGLIYRSDRGCRGRPRTFIHFMKQPPLLACNARGSQLYILGGRYRVTRRGIEG